MRRLFIPLLFLTTLFFTLNVNASQIPAASRLQAMYFQPDGTDTLVGVVSTKDVTLRICQGSRCQAANVQYAVHSTFSLRPDKNYDVAFNFSNANMYSQLCGITPITFQLVSTLANEILYSGSSNSNHCSEDCSEAQGPFVPTCPGSSQHSPFSDDPT